MNKIRKIIYVVLFTILGVLVSSVLHAVIEIWYVGLLIYNFKKFSMGLSWMHLYLLHNLFTAVFFAAGAAAGFIQGLFWWKVIYEKKIK